jgi:hypothetical protein
MVCVSFWRVERCCGSFFSEAFGRAGDSPLRVVGGFRLVLPLGFKLASQDVLADALLEESADASPIAFALAVSVPWPRWILRARGMDLLRRDVPKQVPEVGEGYREALLMGPCNHGVIAAGLLVAVARPAHDPCDLCDVGVAGVAKGEALHDFFGLGRVPVTGRCVPEDLVVVRGAAEDVGRLREPAPGDVVEEALQVGLSVCVHIELEAADLGDVLLLPETTMGVDGIDAEIDVVGVGVEVPEPALVLDGGRLGGGREALEDVTALSRNGQDGDVVVVVVQPLEVSSGDGGRALNHGRVVRRLQ